MANTDLAPSGTPKAGNPLVRLVNELGLFRLSMIAAVAGAVVLGVIYMSSVLTKPPLELLYANLDYQDAATISETLRQEGVAFELRGNGTAIFVDQRKVLDLRMRFAGEGLPQGSDVGYEIFDEQSAFGQTSFTLSLNRQRALEGELSRTIRALSRIESARVHLVLPERELFTKETRSPSASIVLKTRGQIDGETVKAIQHLVASAVQGLDPGKISIVDERGNLLASGGQTAEDALAAINIEDRQASYEERLRQRVLDIVNKYTGTGNAQVQVSAELDLNRVTEQSTFYDPDAQVVASQTTIEEQESGSDREAGEQGVTVANNLPDAQQAQPAAGSTSSSSSSRTEEEITYQNSQTVRTEVREAGKVLRLSIAVLVDGSYQSAADGTRTYQQRAQADLDQITALVKAGIGFDDKRGDQLTVANLPFAQLEVPEGEAAAEPLLGLTKADHFYIAQIAALVIVALVLLLFIVRPMMMQVARAAQRGPVSGGRLEAATGALPAGAGPAAALGAPEGGALALPRNNSQFSSSIDLAQIEGQVKDSSVRKVGEVVANHPEESMAILRTWIQQGD